MLISVVFGVCDGEFVTMTIGDSRYSTVMIFVCCVIIVEKGKLVTWGSTDDENQSYLMSGKHGVMQLVL